MSLLFLVPDEETKPHIPKFPKFAGGFADRLKGLLFALSWADSVGVPLKVYWQNPLPLNDIFDLKSELIDNISTAEVLKEIRDTDANVVFVNLIDLSANEIEQQKSEIDLHDSTKTYVLFANQFNAKTELDRKNALHTVFNSHLGFNSAIQARAHAICPLLQTRQPNTPLLGMQLRVGKHVGASWNDPFLDSKLNWRLMTTVAKDFYKDGSHFLFLSDAANIQFGEGGLNTFKPTWSSGNVHFELSKNSDNERLLDTIAQFYLLSVCTHVVHGRGEFGYLAAAIGGGECVDYYSKLTDRQKKLHKWNHRFSRWRISLAKRF